MNTATKPRIKRHVDLWCCGTEMQLYRFFQKRYLALPPIGFGITPQDAFSDWEQEIRKQHVVRNEPPAVTSTPTSQTEEPAFVLCTFLRLVGMRRKEGLVRSARWAAGLMWRSHQNTRLRSHIE
ncbi:hypothetical protein G7047_14700 [Diaphorobacter sp. HDW4A]|uniref:hypothetical protein n=1 Tax=Diaphorobacter sp. HDW4A TaxID=2714924 RepID=UPI00140D1CE7|nr:hypothetical protein [Diaphorobacter sp. HDW4A]QIL81005.1 hypothetical protein G7047_14700 [Diaphorobacter sp. HDW4A]